VKKNIKLLYGFSFFDQFMIVIAVWVPYLATQGIGMRQFMELQAVFAIVILCGELPSGVLSDLWGRKKTLLLGSTLGANRDDGERAAGGRGRHPVLWASAVGERDPELDPGAPRAAPH